MPSFQFGNDNSVGPRGGNDTTVNGVLLIEFEMGNEY